MTQREAVFNTIVDVVGEVDGNGPVQLTREQKDEVHARLVEGFVNGEIEYRGEGSREQFKKYVTGLVNNWLRKDKRLNGGEKYVPKNPGSRAGSGDEQLKAMRDLLKATTDASARAEIERAIEERKLELKPKVEINIEALPEHLRQYAPQS